MNGEYPKNKHGFILYVRPNQTLGDAISNRLPHIAKDLKELWKWKNKEAKTIAIQILIVSEEPLEPMREPPM